MVAANHLKGWLKKQILLISVKDNLIKLILDFLSNHNHISVAQVPGLHKLTKRGKTHCS